MVKIAGNCEHNIDPRSEIFHLEVNEFFFRQSRFGPLLSVSPIADPSPQSGITSFDNTFYHSFHLLAHVISLKC
jgi:hypothetical protein